MTDGAAAQLAPVYATVIFGAILGRVMMHDRDRRNDRRLRGRVRGRPAVRGAHVLCAAVAMLVHLGHRPRGDHHGRLDRVADDDDGRRPAHDRGDDVPARVRGRVTSSTSRSGSSTRSLRRRSSRPLFAYSCCCSRSTRGARRLRVRALPRSGADYATFAVARGDRRAGAPRTPWALIDAGAADRAIRRVPRRRAGRVRWSRRCTPCSRPRPRAGRATLAAAWIRGVEDVAPAVILMMGIGMLLAATKTPAVQPPCTRSLPSPRRARRSATSCCSGCSARSRSSAARSIRTASASACSPCSRAWACCRRSRSRRR